MEPVVVHAAVEGDGQGNLRVSWDLEGEGPVEVAVGPTPDTVAHGAPTAVVDGPAEVLLRDVGPGRHYVSVAPAGGGPAVVAAERLVNLEGATNFRDLGGYRTVDGGRTRWGRIFRSDALHRLTVEDLAVVGQIGLRVVYDLRNDRERETAPTVELSAEGEVRSVLLAIGGSAGETKEITERILDGEFERIDDEFMAGAYRNMVDRDAPTFGSLLTGLTDPGGLPALFHCTAGKDRTGVAAALLLSVLGADEEAVLDDFELSTRYWSEQRMSRLAPRFAEAGVDIGGYRSLFMAPRASMAAMLVRLREEHGSVDRYLVGRAAMAPETLDELRRLLVQPA